MNAEQLQGHDASTSSPRSSALIGGSRWRGAAWLPAILATAVALVCVGPAAAAPRQCPVDWIKTDGFPGAGVEPEVNAVTTWDPDGAGPQASRLVAAGGFHYMADRIADSIAALNPDTGQWEDLGGGVDIQEPKKKGFADGFVTALGVFQDDLIAAGVFDLAGGVPVNAIARWDGTAWSSLGDGFPGSVTSMTVYNGELITAGSFIRRWDGTSSQPLGPSAELNGIVNNVTVYIGELIAVGNFTTAGGVPANRIARWNGSQWQALGTGLNASGFGLAVLGDDLYVSGNFTLAGGVPNTRGVARWDGANWHPVGGGALFAVSDLVAYHGDIIAGGVFTVTLGGQQVTGLARFDTASQAWVVMEGGFSSGGSPSQFAFHNDELIVVGFFRKIANRTASGIARWSDVTQSWDRIAPGFNWTPTHFTTYRGDLIAGGVFDSAGDAEARGVARWDGQEWHALGGGIGHLPMPSVDALEVYNDELFAAGHFFFADGGNLPVHHIAKWNGDTETWSDVGGGVTGGGAGIPRILDLVVYNGELIAGGDFISAGGVVCNSIARWNGSQWQPLGNGIAGAVSSMVVFEGDLIVSVTSGLNGMQRWDGSAWHNVSNGPNGFDMTVFNGQVISGAQLVYAWDGPGSEWTPVPGYSFDLNGSGSLISAFEVINGELIVAGEFENAAGIPEADGLVRFDGTSWHSLDTGNGTLASITSGIWVHNGELITNGRVEHPDGTMSNWRRWGPGCSGQGDVNGDGVVDVDDLIAVILSWGACQSCTDCAADFDNNCAVDVDDLIAVILNWG